MRLIVVLLVAFVAVVAVSGRFLDSASAVAKDDYPNMCQNCSEMNSDSVCLWCPDAGYRCVKRLPAPKPTVCCGCVGSECVACTDSASCAAWSPYGPYGSGYCPYPANNNSTRFGSCNWHELVSLTSTGPEFQRAVFRCHSVAPQFAHVTIQWDVVRKANSGWLKIQVVDQANFDLYSASKQFKCLNLNCFERNPKITHGQVIASDSPAYYIIMSTDKEVLVSFTGKIE